MFEMVELTLETTAPGGCRQMMSFIHNDGEGLARAQRRFHRFPQFPGAYARHLSIHKRIMESAQDRTVILSPLETACIGPCREATGKGNETGIGYHQSAAFGYKALFEQTNGRGFPPATCA